MWGIIPAAGRGSRIQPLAFSKELLPVGSRILNDTQVDPENLDRHFSHRDLIGCLRLGAERFGDFDPGRESALLPAGSSLHQTGTVRMGTVDDGTSVSDYDEEEKKHKYSIDSSVLHLDHQGKRIYLIDTPGKPDFMGAIQ